MCTNTFMRVLFQHVFLPTNYKKGAESNTSQFSCGELKGRQVVLFIWRSVDPLPSSSSIEILFDSIRIINVIKKSDENNHDDFVKVLNSKIWQTQNPTSLPRQSQCRNISTLSSAAQIFSCILTLILCNFASSPVWILKATRWYLYRGCGPRVLAGISSLARYDSIPESFNDKGERQLFLD